MNDIYYYYRKISITEMAPWHKNFDMDNVSISEEDKKKGSPKLGDMIARNSNNHKDKWLIEKDYFLDNFELIK